MALSSQSVPRGWSLRRSLVFNRLLFWRGNNIVGTLSLGYLTATKLHEQHPKWPLLAIAGVGLLGIWCLGFLEWKLGLWRAEAEINWEINPAQKALTDNPRI